MEGPAVDNSVTQDYLAFEQKVVNWEEDTGFSETLLIQVHVLQKARQFQRER